MLEHVTSVRQFDTAGDLVCAVRDAESGRFRIDGGPRRVSFGRLSGRQTLARDQLPK